MKMAVLDSRPWRLAAPVRVARRATRRCLGLVLRGGYQVYCRLPFSLRLWLRYRLKSLRLYIRARWGQPVASGPLPIDYEQVVAQAQQNPPAVLEFVDPTAPVGTVLVFAETSEAAALRCLHALQQQAGSQRWSVVVLVAGRAGKLSARVQGVRWQVAEGEIATWYAQGCRLARGERLLFLSSHAVLLPDALLELERLFQERPEIGLAVPKLIGADGRLAFPWAELENDPNLPQASYVRPLLACHRLAFMVDAKFADPAIPVLDRHGSLAGLIARLRQRGAWVVHAPQAGVLVDYLAPRPEAWELEETEKARRILILDQLTPTPDKDSGSVDAFFQMKILVGLGYRVSFLPVYDLAYVPRYTADLQRLGVECLYPPYVPSVEQHLAERGGRYDYVILTRVATAQTFLDGVRRYCPRAKIVFNTVDLHFLREERQAQVEGDPELARKARLTRRIETSLMQKVDGTWVISEAEEALLKEAVPGVRIFHLPLVMDIPDRAEMPFADRKDLFFIGGFLHRPNVDAALYFVQEIWPQIRERLPGARFHIVGSHPPPEVLDLAESDVVVTGFVPDAAPYFNGCRFSVAPLRFGAGLKGKVGRSLGYGCPVVASPIAVEGSGLIDGVNVLVAEGAEAFADAVVALYRDEERWQTLSANGIAFYESHYSFAVGQKRIAEIFDTLENRHVEQLAIGNP
ncbi:MAG TPA: glycosyltransferase [Candidatus Competibacter sp.]|nr:glycosyltransferase [Candidatus Competibacter sp.]